MFPRRYFAAAVFAPRYWPPGGPAAAPYPFVVCVTGRDGKAVGVVGRDGKAVGVEGRDGRVASVTGRVGGPGCQR
jgi:hypothetical protein